MFVAVTIIVTSSNRKRTADSRVGASTPVALLWHTCGDGFLPNLSASLGCYAPVRSLTVCLLATCT